MAAKAARRERGASERPRWRSSIPPRRRLRRRGCPTTRATTVPALLVLFLIVVFVATAAPPPSGHRPTLWSAAADRRREVLVAFAPTTTIAAGRRRRRRAGTTMTNEEYRGPTAPLMRQRTSSSGGGNRGIGETTRTTADGSAATGAHWPLKKKKRPNENVRRIVALLEERFPLRDDGGGGDVDNDDNDRGRRRWAKTRNYLYKTPRVTVEQARVVLDFLDEVFPGQVELQEAIVQNSPRILRKHVKSHLKPTVEFLRGLYGADVFYQAISRNTNLLLTSGLGYDGTKGDDVENFLRNDLGMTASALSKMKKSAPRVFQISLEKNARPVCAFLSSVLKGHGGTNEEVQKSLSKAIEKWPGLLQLGLETNLRPTVRFLTESCGLSKQDMAQIICHRPSLLALSVATNLRPKTVFLSSILATVLNGESEKGQCGQAVLSVPSGGLLRKCIMKHPQLLALSVDNLKAKIAYFDAVDRIASTEESASRSGSLSLSSSPPHISLAAKILSSAPSIFSLSLRDNIIPKIDFLGRLWGALVPSREYVNSLLVGNEEVVDLLPSSVYVQDTCVSLAERLAEYPLVLTLSLEGNIKPTVSFLLSCGYPVSSLRSRHIAASLFQRLLPRWHYLKERGLQYSSRAEALEPPTLQVLAVASDEKFCSTFKLGPVTSYLEFKKERGSTLKFTSQFDTWLKTGRPIDECTL